jgi:putative DNA primase/helicase
LKRSTKLLRGRCPLPGHDDSSPSFYLYPDGHAYCFGCGWHGDAVDLWAALKGFPTEIEAALDLAREYSIDLPERAPEAQQKAAKQRQRETTFAQQAEACYHALESQPLVSDWWLKRGFSAELQQRFLLGTDGVGSAGVIPFWQRGRVLGLIRRQLEREPKYLLPTAETFANGHKPLFVLFVGGDIHLVEGFVDALACGALDLSVAAIGGTGISDAQLAELDKLKGNIFIFPDADEEGAKAGRNWVRLLFPRAKLCPAEYGTGRKDVADLFAVEGENARAMLEALKARAVDALDLALVEAPKGSTRERWRYANDRVLPLLLKLVDEGERHAAIDDTAKALALKASDLKRAVKPQATEEASDNNSELVLHEPELWSEEVAGAALLGEIAAVVRRFLSASEHICAAVALWVVYTYAFESFDISPLLAIVSPEKRCGKTTLLILLNALVPRPLATANITAAALFRTVEKFHPTLLIDEADSFATDNEELRGVLNSGYGRATSFVIRTTGEEHEPRRFTTWTPKAIALIGSLPGTLEDRSILIRLQRKRTSDQTQRIRHDRLGEFEHLRQRAARWVEDNKDTLRAADPEIPPEITNDRAQDNWRPLLSIADAAGGEWPERARLIARLLAGGEPDSESARTLLLGDLKALFAERTAGRLTSEVIIQALVELESRPWAEWKGGKSLSKVALAKLLKPFGVEPKKWRDRQLQTQRGYYLTDFEDSFARYLGIESPHSPQPTETTTYDDNALATTGYSVATANDDNSNEINVVANVASANTEIDDEDANADGDFLAADESIADYEQRYNERHGVSKAQQPFAPGYREDGSFEAAPGKYF